MSYEIVSDVKDGKITATVDMPSRRPPRIVHLRLRHPTAARIRAVEVNGAPWKDVDTEGELIQLKGQSGRVVVIDTLLTVGPGRIRRSFIELVRLGDLRSRESPDLDVSQSTGGFPGCETQRLIPASLDPRADAPVLVIHGCDLLAVDPARIILPVTLIRNLYQVLSS